MHKKCIIKILKNLFLKKWSKIIVFLSKIPKIKFQKNLKNFQKSPKILKKNPQKSPKNPQKLCFFAVFSLFFPQKNSEMTLSAASISDENCEFRDFSAAFLEFAISVFKPEIPMFVAGKMTEKMTQNMRKNISEKKLQKNMTKKWRKTALNGFKWFKNGFKMTKKMAKKI
jgi:hypothetical protein